MAEGFLKDFDKNLEVFSAGTKLSHEVHPNAIEVMHEVGIDLTKSKPESVEEYLNHSFDYVITVCGGAKESCPTFMGDVKNNIHIGFEDPADATGTEEEIMTEFRKVRDEIERDFLKFYNDL
jgi:arsenate reductase